MSLIADAKTSAALPPDSLHSPLDALPTGVLAARWRALQHLGLKERTDESWADRVYFDRLPDAAPERAFDLVLDVLRAEDDVDIRMELGDRMADLFGNRRADVLIDRIEVEASRNPRLCWLLGGAYWRASDPAVRARLRHVADEAGWRADDNAHAARGLPINFAALATPDLARIWVELKAKPNKDRDRNWSALIDFERDLLDRDPDAVIDLILAIVAIETHPALLSLLAAGLLEDVISLKAIERIEREAGASERFRGLLGRVWFGNEPAELQARLDAVVNGGS